MLSAAVLRADETDREPNILLFTKSAGTDKEIIKEIDDTASARLKSFRLNSIRIEDDTTTDELLDNAGWLGAFFLIESEYRASGGERSLILNCYSAWDKQLLISVYRESASESFLPAGEVERALGKIIPVIQTHLEIVKAQPPPGWDWWSRKRSADSGEEGGTDAQTETEPTQLPRQPEREQKAGDEQSAVAPFYPLTRGEGTAETTPESSRIHVSLAGAPLIATGEAGDYFDFGSHLSLFGGYRLLRSPLTLSAGARLAWDRFEGEGVLASSINNFYCIGPEVQAGLDLRRRGRVFARLGGGLSSLRVDSEHQSQKTVVLPYLSIGLGAEMLFTEHFGLYYSGDYTLHFEKSTLFSGFYPAFGISYYI